MARGDRVLQARWWQWGTEVGYLTGMVGYQTLVVGYQTGGKPDVDSGIPDADDSIPDAYGVPDMR